MKEHQERICIYFIIDNALPLLLYVGETMQTAKQRWNGTHDCKDYMMNYQSDWTLPELKIPVLDFLKNEALWITSYLDEDMRIGRGATGNLFVFRR